MKKLIFLILFFFNSIVSFSQDLIILKKGEVEIKCSITSVTDTSIVYVQQNNSDKTSHSISKSDVLTYLISQKSEVKKGDSNNNISIKEGADSDPNITTQNQSGEARKQGLLGLYKSDEVVEGFIIKLNRDSLFGKIKISNVAMNQLEVVFESDGNNKYTTYSTNDLLGYGYNGIYYELINISIKGEVTNNRKVVNDKLFLHREINGSAKLYRYYTLYFKGNFSESDGNPPYYLGSLKMHYVISNKSGQIICSKGRTLKGTVNRIFSDDPNLKDYVYKNGLDEQKLFDVISIYNKNH